jgi:hypothetical protein
MLVNRTNSDAAAGIEYPARMLAARTNALDLIMSFIFE